MKLFITGALSGLGYQYAKEAAKRGHIVYAGVKEEKQKKILEEKSQQEHIILFPVVFDIEKEKSDQLLEEELFDAIILQAGIAEGGSLLELSIKRLKHNYNVNVFSNFRMIQCYIKSCLKNNIKGKIFLTSSLAAFLPLPYLGSYTSSKISLYSLGRTLQKELKVQKIKVSITLIMPGAYHTGFNDYMILNKEEDPYLIPISAKKVTKKQKIMFSIIETDKLEKMAKKIIKAVEKNKCQTYISYPIIQRIGIKLYRILTSFIELS